MKSLLAKCIEEGGLGFQQQELLHIMMEMEIQYHLGSHLKKNFLLSVR